MVKKAINAEAKSALRPCSSTKEMDQNYPQGNWPTNSTVAKSQDSAMKNPWSEEPKVQGIESLSGPQQSKSSEKARKEKKKEQCWRDWKRQESSTPTADANAAQAEPHQKIKKKHCSDKAPWDKSQVKYFNCSKLGHYANVCPEPKN